MTDDLTNRLRAAVEQGGRLDLVVAVLLTAEARDLLDEVDGERPSVLVCRGTPEGHAECEPVIEVAPNRIMRIAPSPEN